METARATEKDTLKEREMERKERVILKENKRERNK